MGPGHETRLTFWLPGGQAVSHPSFLPFVFLVSRLKSGCPYRALPHGVFTTEAGGTQRSTERIFRNKIARGELLNSDGARGFQPAHRADTARTIGRRSAMDFPHPSLRVPARRAGETPAFRSQRLRARCDVLNLPTPPRVRGCCGRGARAHRPRFSARAFGGGKRKVPEKRRSPALVRVSAGAGWNQEQPRLSPQLLHL